MTKFARRLVAWLQTEAGAWWFIGVNAVAAIPSIWSSHYGTFYLDFISFEALVMAQLILVGQGIEGKAMHLKLDAQIISNPEIPNALAGSEKLDPPVFDALVAETDGLHDHHPLEAPTIVPEAPPSFYGYDDMGNRIKPL